MARGGKNYPREPAPVSGPGAASRRTDGGAGSASQPIRVAPGGPYDSRQTMVEQQSAAPMAAGSPPPPAPGASGPPGATPPPAVGGGISGAFGPTERPGESPLAGMATRGNAVASDVDGFLRVMYSVFQHPAIGALLRKDM